MSTYALLLFWRVQFFVKWYLFEPKKGPKLHFVKLGMLLPLIHLGFPNQSFANNATVCRTALSPSIETNSIDSELDALLAQLNVESRVSQESDSTPFAPTNQNYQTMNVSELVQSLGLKPYQVRLAAAEILKHYEPGATSTLQLKAENKKLLSGLVNDSLSAREKLHLSSYRSILEELVSRSRAVHRFEIMNQYDVSDTPLSMDDLFETQSPIAKPAKRKNGIMGFFKKENRTSSESLPFENAEQFARSLSERPANMRLEIIRQQATSIGLLSHLELYRILMAIPKVNQSEVYGKLRLLLIGRLDFYPIEVLKLAADIESTATLDIYPVSEEIILGDLIESGQDLNLFDVYEFLKALNFGENDIKLAFDRH